MTEPRKAAQPAHAPAEKPAATASASDPQPRKVISDPREIAAIIMAQLGVVNAKKDDLAKAVTTMTDLTQQLVMAYTQQAQFLQRLAQRAKALEAKPNGGEPRQRAA